VEEAHSLIPGPQCVAKNSLWSTLSNLADSPSRFVFLLLAARLFALGDYRQFMLVFSLAAFLARFLGRRLDISTVREIESNPQKREIYLGHEFTFSRSYSMCRFKSAYDSM